MKSFSPSLVFTAWNFGAKIVPITKAVKEIHIPVRFVYFSTKMRKPTNKTTNESKLNRKARNCNLVMILCFVVNLLMELY